MNRTLSAFLLAAGAPAFATPAFTHQGRLLDASGAPIEGLHDVTVALFEDASSPAPLWRQVYPDVPFSMGFFTVLLDGADPSGVELSDVLVTDRHLAIEVAGQAPFARQPIRSVPSSHRTEGAAHVDASTACTLAGGLGWDDARGALFVCDGSSWTEVGTRRLPTLYRVGLPTRVTPPNTDRSCGVNANSPWVYMPGMSVTFTVSEPTEIQISLAGAIGDQGGATTGLHCAVRYRVDGDVVPGGDASWGHHMVSRDLWGWWGLGSERRTVVPAGTHTVSAQARTGLCSTPSSYETGLCIFEAIGAPAHGTYMHVQVP